MEAFLVLADPTSGGPAATLIGIGAILAAVVPLGVAAINRRRRSPDDPVDAELLLQRINVLKDTIADLNASLERCRQDAQVTDAEARISHLKIMELEAALRACRGDR